MMTMMMMMMMVLHDRESFLHVRSERWDQVPGNDEGCQVANVHKALVPVGQSGPEVVVPTAASCSHRLAAKSPQHQLHVIVSPFGDQEVNLDQEVQDLVGLIESWLIPIQGYQECSLEGTM